MKWLIVIALASACVSTNGVQCDDGTICPAHSTCERLAALSMTVCATSAQLDACAGQAEGALCGSGMECHSGVCWPFQCGDGRVDTGEVCDDGNTDDGDGCSKTCNSREICGNGIIDPVKLVNGTLVPNEECDDGNLADHDGCTSRCTKESPQWNDLRLAGMTPRESVAMAYDVDHGVTVMFGGMRLISTDTIASDETWLWDGTTWRATSPRTRPPPQSSSPMAYDASRHRAVMFTANTLARSAAGDTWEWDGHDWVERTALVVPAARREGRMVYDSARKRVVLYGGIGAFSNGIQLFSDQWDWDGTTWTPNAMTTPGLRAAHGMAYDPKHGQIVVFGGVGPGRFGSTTVLSDTWLYDDATGAWSLATPAAHPSAREAMAMAWDEVGQRVLLYGGSDGTNDLQDVWSWDGTNWTPVATTTPAGTRSNHVMALDTARGRIVTFGGITAMKNNLDTFEWTGSAFVDPTTFGASGVTGDAADDVMRGRAVMLDAQTFVSNGPDWTTSVAVPGVNAFAAITYDAARDATIAFGGQDRNSGSASDETSSWDGSAWHLETPATRPPPREHAHMVYDADHKETVLFGGADTAGNDLGDTWLWDGATWRDAMPATSPPARHDFALGYDSHHHQVVLFGGVDMANNDLGDTWLWDGTTWTHATDDGPGPRTGPAIAMDPRPGKLILFGGINMDYVAAAGTWEWTGTAWQDVAPAGAPAGRANPSMFAADSAGLYMAGGLAPDVWQLRWDGDSPPESCTRADLDADGDGLAGCDDPDCAGVCAPFCNGVPAAPGMKTCDDSLPHCGDGRCDPLETCRMCPGDCGACTAVCGDLFCDAPETAASCPGDCR